HALSVSIARLQAFCRRVSCAEALDRVAVLVACVTVATLLSTAPSARADSICGNQNCKPESEHPISSLKESDGMGGAAWVANISPRDLPKAAKDACKLFANAHSNAGSTYTFDDTCVPVLPVPDANAGGTF